MGQDISDIKQDDYLLVFEPSESEDTTVFRTIGSPDRDSLVASLKRLADVYADGSQASLLDNAILKDNLVAVYCLVQLLDLPGTITAPPDYPTKLQLVADDPKQDTNIRLMAYQLAARISDRAGDSASEFAWLKAAISGDKSNDYEQVRPLVQRMLDLQDQRGATATLLLGWVRDRGRSAQVYKEEALARPKNPPAANSSMDPYAIWDAAYEALHDPRLFNYKNPDQISETIFTFAVSMLKDQQPEIRISGADLLKRIREGIAPPNWQVYYERVATAIQNVLENEKDAEVRSALEDDLN
jgi:hypothetical protein